MHRLNNKFLKAIPVMFTIVMAIKIIYSYYDTKDREYNFAKSEAEVLNSYVLEHRHYYQNLFLNGNLEINEKSLPAVPAFSATPISKSFSQNNPLNISVKTVSENPRNPNNQADSKELRAIEYFKKNSSATTYFSEDDKDIYQFGSVLKIEQRCLKCHGNKENAPEFIQNKYDTAYNYKIGDIRGIVSIQIPKYNLDAYFFKNFTKSILFDILLSILLFSGVAYIIKHSKKLNEILEDKVIEKTKELKESFLTDKLTALPNRLKLIEDIENNLNTHSRHLALINIDSFKHINDLYGYEFGDKVLLEVANRIRNFCNKLNHVYKLPNDEFAVFTTDSLSDREFFTSIKELMEKIEEKTFDIDNESIFVSFSCGIASNQEQILIKASAAIQIAKKEARSIIVYDNSLDAKEQISKNIDTLLMLKDAIANDNIVPYFQPIYNVKTKQIDKYEALARVITNDAKVVTPFLFLDVAIKSKLYPEITKTMINKTFEFFKDKDFEFSLNLSILDIHNQETMRFIENKLSNYDAKKVTFEILESDKIDNYEDLKTFIQIVKKYGSKVAIDDFGSGYSNFSHIFALNVDYLKIDASLVKFITTDNSSRVIVKTIINFASNLGLKTIAEFVEDKDSLDILEKMGIDYVQGYYIGKPLSQLNSDI